MLVSQSSSTACSDLSIVKSLHDTIIDEVPGSVVTVSPKFRVVIPREIREALRLEPAQKVQVLQYQNRVEFIPVQTMRKMRVFFERHRHLRATGAGPRVNLIDSLAWLEYFAGGPPARSGASWRRIHNAFTE